MGKGRRVAQNFVAKLKSFRQSTRGYSARRPQNFNEIAVGELFLYKICERTSAACQKINFSVRIILQQIFAFVGKSFKLLNYAYEGVPFALRIYRRELGLTNSDIIMARNIHTKPR